MSIKAFLLQVAFIIIILDTKFQSVTASIHSSGVREVDLAEIDSIREKRAARLLIGPATVILGSRARRKILTGARLTHSSANNRQFVKTGTYKDALKDFYSVHPTDITSWNEFWGRVKAGIIGDKRITVKASGLDGKPVLEIVDYNVHAAWGDQDVLVDTITYIK